MCSVSFFISLHIAFSKLWCYNLYGLLHSLNNSQQILLCRTIGGRFKGDVVMWKKNGETSFTEGGIFLKLFAFLLPILASNYLQAFYKAADMIAVSFSSEENALAAIGNIGPFLSTILNLFMGLSVGTNVVVAKRIGARDHDQTQKAVHTAVLVGLIVGLLGMAVGLIAIRPLLHGMGATGNLLRLSVRYANIYFLGVPFSALTNFLIAIFRAKGNSKTPLAVLSIAGLMNVALNFFFVLALDMSVEGVAIATAASNAFSATVLFVKLQRAQDDTRISWKKLRPDKIAVRDIMINGIPAGLQATLISLSNVITQGAVVQVNNYVSPGGVHSPVLEGHAAVGNLETFIASAMSAVNEGAITFTSQNFGAQKPRRVYRILRCCLGMVMLAGLLPAHVLYVFREPFLAMYGVEAGEGLAQIAFDTAITRFHNMTMLFFLIGMSNCCAAVLRGIGKAHISMAISLICSCLLQALWILFVFPLNPIIEMVYISYPLVWVISGTIAFIVLLVFLRKMTRTTQMQEAV